MGYKEKYKLDKKWWHQKKSTYIFDSNWIKDFESIDPFFKVPPAKENGHPNVGRMGIVFWHDEEGKDIFPVGVIANDGKQCKFAYHPEYRADPDTPEISVTLPKNLSVHVSDNVEDNGLIPFFDNLISEGWLGYLQHEVIGKVISPHHGYDHKKYHGVEHFKINNHFNPDERYRRLLMFGRGFHGAVSVIDVNASDQLLEQEQKLMESVLLSGATIGGGAPKALAVFDGKIYRVAKREDISTHLVKIPGNHGFSPFPLDGMKNEYLNIKATQALLPDDQTADGDIAMYMDDKAKATMGLFIKRFDRNERGGRIQFEEALQIIGQPANQMNSQSYPILLSVGNRLGIKDSGRILFKRVLAQWMLGNADGHAKNFGVWKRKGEWSWTPNYDLETTDNVVANGEPCTGIPMKIDGKYYDIYDIKSRELFLLGKDLGLKADEIKQQIEEVRERFIPKESPLRLAIERDQNQFIDDEDKGVFISRLEFRCNRLFAGLDIAYQNAKKAETAQTLQ